MRFLALALIVSISAASSQSAELVNKFNRAVELQRAGLFQEAANQYQSILAAAPNYAEAHANLGVVLMRLDRYEEAIQSYETALRLSPGLTAVVLNLGIAHYRRGEFEKAMTSFNRFLENAPNHVQAMQLLGLSLVELERDQEAVPVLSKTLTAAPEDPAVLYALGLSSLRLGRSDVTPIIERLNQTPGGLAASRLLRGQLLLSRLEFEKAAAELESAARVNAELPRLHYSLGLAYFKMGRYRDSLKELELEWGRAPKDFSTLYYLSYVHELLGSFGESRQYIEKALALQPDSAEANALMGKLLVKQGNTREGVKYLEAAVTKDPEDSEKKYLLARTYQQLGRSEEAKRQFSEIQRLKAKRLEKDRARLPKP